MPCGLVFRVRLGGGRGGAVLARAGGVPPRPPVPPQRHDCPQLGGARSPQPGSGRAVVRGWGTRRRRLGGRRAVVRGWGGMRRPQPGGGRVAVSGLERPAASAVRRWACGCSRLGRLSICLCSCS
ncbi:hypothetical protein DI272_17020 [Streptomyces sp. Act143]|nr:hypothetical protein DI272_17020 [Streptomyces sp. Act143]